MSGRRKGKGKAARRDAQLRRLASQPGPAVGSQRRERERRSAERAAGVAPSAARWLVPSEAAPGEAAPIDVVADLLALGPRPDLRGRAGAALRALAGHVADLVEAGAVLASGRSLVELVTDDPELAEQLRPQLDLDALLSGGPVPGDRHDRTVRTAGALVARAAAHRDGTLDLYALAAPVGTTRHPHADEVEATVRVALDGLPVPAGADPAISVIGDGWVGAGPYELFLGAARGSLMGRVADVAGAALVRWLNAGDATSADWLAVQRLAPVDAPALVQAAAARAGSDHPDVAGSALVELVALRYPLSPPS